MKSLLSSILRRYNPKISSRIIAATVATVICLSVYLLTVAMSHFDKSPDIDDSEAEKSGNEGNDETADNTDGQTSAPVFSENGAETVGNQLSSASAILCDITDNTVICKKSERNAVSSVAALPLAVALTVINEIDNGKISASDRAVCPSSAVSLACYSASSHILSVGRALSVAELVKCMFADDPRLFAYVLAIHICGSESAFVEKINTLNKELGANDTVFSKVSDISAQSSTALDTAILFRAAFQNTKLAEIITSPAAFSVSPDGDAWSTVSLSNRFFSECCSKGQALADSIKGGIYFKDASTQFAVSVFESGGKSYIAVALSSATAYADCLILRGRV